MSNILYTKETFIYENLNSISDEICNDIIEIYENEKIDSELYNMNISKKYDKIQKYLTIELQQNICNYQKRINIIQEKYQLVNFFPVSKMQYTFFIEKNNKKELNITTRYSNNSAKLLMFIWVLNEYNGEFTFCNQYKIKSKPGKLIIFPVSWCFPYEELISMEANKYIIYGFIY